MNRTLIAWRLEALYGENSVGSEGNSACTGLMPTKSAPCAAASRSTSMRSVKSPMPQLCSERSVYSCTATPQSLRARAECRRLVALVRRDDQRATLGAGELELDAQAVISRRQIRQRQVAQHEPAPVELVRAAFRQIPGAALAAALAAALELHAPAQQRIVFDGRRIEPGGARAIAQHHHVA